MKDWTQRLDAIIHLNGREFLTHASKISHQMAVKKSASEYDKFRETQKKKVYEESLRKLEQDLKHLEPCRRKETDR